MTSCLIGGSGSCLFWLCWCDARLSVVAYVELYGLLVDQVCRLLLMGGLWDSALMGLLELVGNVCRVVAP